MRTLQQSERKILLRNREGKPCATVQDGVLRRTARKSVHLLHKPPSWCFEVQILKQAEQYGASTVQIRDAESGQVFTAPLQAFWTRGVLIERGHGEQIALPLTCWRVEKPNPSGQLILSLLTENQTHSRR